MNLNRKTLIGGVLALLIIVSGSFAAGTMFTGASSAPVQSNSDTPTTTEDAQEAENPPAAVNASKPQAEEIYVQAVDRGYQNVGVYIQKDGNIVVQYDTQSQSEQQVKNEIQQLALMFAEIEGEPTSITIVTGNVQAIVPEPSVTAYRNDNLKEEAFKETIAYRNVGDTEQTEDGSN